MKKYLDTAPMCLRGFRTRADAKKLLSLLLCDPRMKKPWERLSRKINTDAEWIKLWVAINSSIRSASNSRKPKCVQDEAGDLKSVAEQAANLARVIEIESPRRRNYKGFFNHRCYRFFPADVMEINGIPNWSKLDPMEQSAAVSNVMREWPTMAELLDGLAAEAIKQAGNVESNRTVLKVKERWAETTFIRNLHDHLVVYQWDAKDAIFATIAVITNMVIQANLIKQEVNEEVSPKFVRNAATS